MRIQIFNRMLLFNFVVSCGFYRMKLFFLLDRILIRKLISLLLFLKMAVECSTLKGTSIIPLRLKKHPRTGSRECRDSTMGRRTKEPSLWDLTWHCSHELTHSGCRDQHRATQNWTHQPSVMDWGGAHGVWLLLLAADCWGNRNLWFK